VEPLRESPTKPADYAALSAGYGALLGGLLVAARDHGDEPVPPAEMLPLGLATFALAKLVAREKIESWIREPFVEETPDGDRRPKGRRLRYAVGELITCTRCAGAWASLGLVALRVKRPREARILTALLGASAVNDFLQASFTWLCGRANLEQQRGGEPTPTEPRAARLRSAAQANHPTGRSDSR
jgi:hypothetical protein